MAKYDSGGNKITLYFIIGFIVVVAAGLIIAAVYSNGASSSTNPPFVATTVPALTSADWTVGNKNAAVSVIEYGDYECPACGAYFPIVQQLIANFSSTVLFAFRNFPLYTIHPDAGIAAQAAEAAGLQGKFWQMHDQLYETQATWSTVAPAAVVSTYFNGYAQTLGLNVTKFDADIESQAVTSKIQNDVTGGTAAQIDHTPTFFINLTQIPNPTSYADFAQTIDNALASSTGASVPVVNVNVSPSSSGILTVTSTQL